MVPQVEGTSVWQEAGSLVVEINSVLLIGCGLTAFSSLAKLCVIIASVLYPELCHMKVPATCQLMEPSGAPKP